MKNNNNINYIILNEFSFKKLCNYGFIFDHHISHDEMTNLCKEKFLDICINNEIYRILLTYTNNLNIKNIIENSPIYHNVKIMLL